jgi:alpha-ketoglutaric semialdehyde dehydrogenase
VVHQTTAANLLGQPTLEDEVLGPSSVLVGCDDLAQMRAAAEHLSGQLTATLQIDDGDHAAARTLLPILERKAGRILANGFPTGVEVGYAMVHGGPYPATSDSRSTSVGATAMARFLRPVCYQDLPEGLLPAALTRSGLSAQWRIVDGEMRPPQPGG